MTFEIITLVATVAAIILGPVVGVLIARHLQDRSVSRDRRMDIFRVLMRTRRTRMWPDHVGALNLVEIEFAKDREVIDTWRALFQHLGQEHTRRPEEAIADGLNDQETGERNRRYDARLVDERQRLLAKLLHAMARALGFRIEQLEIFEGGYTPQGWADIDFEQSVIRRFFAQLALSQRALPIAVIDYTRVPQAQDAGGGVDQRSDAA